MREPTHVVTNDVAGALAWLLLYQLKQREDIDGNGKAWLTRIMGRMTEKMYLKFE